MIKQLGRYEIICEIGQGAMGIVYKARDPLIDRVVAIKTINLALALDEKDEYEGRFYQEAKAAGRLNHPNIVTIYDVGKSGDIAYIAMEFLQGSELRDVMTHGVSLPADRAFDIAAQVAQGLAYAHEHEIVHRDIKPSNIMLVRDGFVKITDFGIARMASSAIRTQTGMVLGSPKYMSPEQVMGKTVDQRSDIFSLGVMLYEMLTGQTPFDGENVNAIMYQTLKAAPTPPCILNPALPEMVNFIVAKALAKNLEDRYQNATDLAVDLRACYDSLPRGKRIDLLQGGGEKRLSDAIDFSGRMNIAEEELTPAAGLSQVFDSASATMRLAALTATSEEVDELASTMKIKRQNGQASIQVAPAARVFRSNPPDAEAPPFLRKFQDEPLAEADNSKLMLVAVIVVLILLSIAAILA